MSNITLLAIVTPTQKDIHLARELTRRITDQARSSHHLRVQIVDGSQQSEPIEVPAPALRLLLTILSEMGSGNAITLVPAHAELTTQQAADLLHVSRPFFIRLLEDGTIPYRKVGSHRRVLHQDILDYTTRIDAQRIEALAELTAQAQELNMGY